MNKFKLELLIPKAILGDVMEILFRKSPDGLEIVDFGMIDTNPPQLQYQPSKPKIKRQKRRTASTPTRDAILKTLETFPSEQPFHGSFLKTKVSKIYPNLSDSNFWATFKHIRSDEKTINIEQIGTRGKSQYIIHREPASNGSQSELPLNQEN